MHLKEFLKEPGGIDTYPEIKVKYISGHNPDLLVNSGSQPEERIDLTKYNGRDMLLNLLKEKGFKKTSFQKSKTENCHSRVLNGECTKNPDFMNMYCKYSCLKYEL